MQHALMVRDGTSWPRHGERREITIDVLLESEDMWWGLLTLFDADLAIDPRDMTRFRA